MRIAIGVREPPPAMNNVDWVIIGSVLSSLGTGLLIALGAECAAGECEDVSRDGQAPMIIVATASSALVVGGVVFILLGAPPPDPEGPRHRVHAAHGLSPTGATFRLDF